MKNCVVTFCLLTLVGAPLMASAQGFSDGTSCVLDLNVGYTTDLGMTKFSDMVVALVNADLDYATSHALSLGASVPIDVNGGCTVRLGGVLTLPFSQKVEASTPPPNSFHERDWSGDTFWGAVEALIICPINSSFSTVAGFRWDNWQTSLSNPSKFYPPAFYTPTDTGALTVNTYLPLLGIISSRGGLTFGALGFPYVPGDMDLRETSGGIGSFFTETGSFGSGYFLELFSDYNLPAAPLGSSGLDGAFSVFVKLSILRASGQSVWRTTGGFNGNIPEETDFSFQRNLLSIGANATILFAVPGWISGGIL